MLTRISEIFIPMLKFMFIPGLNLSLGSLRLGPPKIKPKYLRKKN